MRISTRRLRAWSIGLLAVAATLGASAADAQLLQAVRNGDAAGVRELIGRHADVNVRQGDGATALHWAAHLDDLETAGLLIRAGAAVDATNDLGATPLWVATTAGSAAMVAKLLAADGDPNIAPDTGGTPLMIAARQGNVAAVRSLLAHGADVNAREGAQRTDRAHVGRFAATSGGRAGRCWTPGRICTRARSRPAGTSCCAARRALARPRAPSGSSRAASRLCCLPRATGDAASAELLVTAGAPIDAAAAAGTTPLVVAAQHGFHDVAAVLLEQGADPDADDAGQAALHWAALRGDRELAETLLAHGANPDVRLARGSLLKRRDMRAFAFDKFLVGATPFVLAARRADTRLMRLLADAGADTSLPLQDGRTAAMVAAGGRTTGLLRLRLAEWQILETVGSALDLGVDVNAASLSGDTALHVAADSRFDGVIRLLAERGALVNARNRTGQTPLAVALAPPEAPDGSAIGGAALGRYREIYAAWVASAGRTPTANLLRSLGGTE